MPARSRAPRITAYALFAALIALCAQLQLPLPALPVNMALFAVLLCGMLCPVRGSLASVSVYLAIGCCGVPVFSGFMGGPAVLFGPHGGYLFGYLAAAALCSALSHRFGRSLWPRALCGMGGALVCSALGMPWMLLCGGLPMTPGHLAFLALFIPFDLVKAVLAAAVSLRLEKALSGTPLLPGRK